MNVLLVYPEYPPTFWSFKHALKFINKKASLPPLGLLTVASLLPHGWKKKLVDLNVAFLKDEDLNWADYVMVSGMIVQKRSASEVIQRAKASGKFVIAGGPLFTTSYSEFPDVDCFVLNEGEVTIPKFLKDMEQGKIKRFYSSDEKPDMMCVPVPDWSLINLKDYASMSLQVSRGCPFDCEFCDVIIMNGRKPRLKTPDQVILELNALYDAGWRGSLFIVDDNFIGNKAKIKLILNEIAGWMHKKHRPFVLYTEASLDIADDTEIMQLMQKANFNSVFIGIESPEEESLISCGKLQNIGKDMVDKVKILQKNGLQVQGGFIVGFDTDTPGIFDNMISFIQKSGIVTAMVGLLVAFPETQLYKRLHSAGRIIKNPSGNNTDFTLNFVPKMNQETLIQGYKKILNSIFSNKNYNKRIITFLKEYKKSSTDKRFSTGIRLRALFMTMWKMGITEKGKWYFWKMFFWTAFRKPELMSEAISQSIYGFHYRSVLMRDYD
jgi:radical SAM superfamily enzyme YgiQ (UPF0313 family)